MASSLASAGHVSSVSTVRYLTGVGLFWLGACRVNLPTGLRVVRYLPGLELLGT